MGKAYIAPQATSNQLILRLYDRHILRGFTTRTQFTRLERSFQRRLAGTIDAGEILAPLFNSEIWPRLERELRLGGERRCVDFRAAYRFHSIRTSIRRLAAVREACYDGMAMQVVKRLLARPLLERLREGPRIVDDPARIWHRHFPDVVLTCYFATKPDPQTDGYVRCDHFGYIQPWYESMRRIGAHGVVLHDCLSDAFIRKHTTSKIKFVKCRLGRYSMNDERFMLYLYFLLHNDYRRVFMTDVTDVVVNRVPFEIIHPGDTCRVFVGRDRINLIGHSTFVKGMIHSYQQSLSTVIEPEFYNCPVFNAGVVGGNYGPVVYLLFLMTQEFLKLCSPFEHDMMVLSYVLYRFFHQMSTDTTLNNSSDKVVAERDHHSSSEYVVSGFPLCSEFFKYQFRSDAYFIHK